MPSPGKDLPEALGNDDGGVLKLLKLRVVPRDQGLFEAGDEVRGDALTKTMVICQGLDETVESVEDEGVFGA